MTFQWIHVGATITWVSNLLDNLPGDQRKRPYLIRATEKELQPCRNSDTNNSESSESGVRWMKAEVQMSLFCLRDSSFDH